MVDLGSMDFSELINKSINNLNLNLLVDTFVVIEFYPQILRYASLSHHMMVFQMDMLDLQ